MKLYWKGKDINCKIISLHKHNDLITLEISPSSNEIFSLYSYFAYKNENYIYIDKDKSKRYSIQDLRSFEDNLSSFEINKMYILELRELPKHLWGN